MHSSAAGVPSPAADVQLPPSAGRMSRSRPPTKTMRNCTLEPRSSALQSRTATILHGARRPRIDLDGYWGLTAVCRSYYLPLPLFPFPKPFGPRRPAQLLIELRHRSHSSWTVDPLPCASHDSPHGRSEQANRTRIGDERGIDKTLSRQVRRSDHTPGTTSETP